MKYRIKDYPEYREQVNAMSVDELLLAVVCPNVWKGREAIRDTAGVFIHAATTEDAAARAAEINEGRELPAVIVSDMEYGPGKMILGTTSFPSMRAAAEAGDEELAYQMGVIAAKDARAAGYHWTFGPVVDILENHFNPIVNIRTPGEDADTVIRYAGAYMRGLQDNGLAATLKHFPGDGLCKFDQHLTTAINPQTREEWDETFGKVYSELIEQGAKSVMIGHIALPSYDEIDEQTGLYPPATVSRNLMTGLLKEKLGFEGIIVSDAVNMGGIANYTYLYDGLARFLEAGGDCLLFVRDLDEYKVEMKKCIDAGVLTLEALRDRAYRMTCFRREIIDEASAPFTPVVREEAEKVAQEMAEKCVKLVRDRKGTLPFKLTKETKVAHVVLHNNSVKDFTCTDDLSRRIGERCTVDTLVDPGPERLRTIACESEYDLIICSVLTSPDYATNAVHLSGAMARNMCWGWMKYPTPTVFLSYYSPYFCEEYEAATDAIINTYGYNQYTNNAVERILFGE